MRSEQIKNQLEIVQGDITKLDCDCIVNAANATETAGRDLEAPAGGSAGSVRAVPAEP